MPAPSADDSTPSSGAPAMKPEALNIIRFALLGGVLTLGLAGWFLTSSGSVGAGGDDDVAAMFRYAFYGFLLIDLGAMWVVRRRVDRATTFAEKGPLILVGYALGEGLALFGLVYWLVTGRILLFLVGLLVLLAAFLVFPVQPDSDSV